MPRPGADEIEATVSATPNGPDWTDDSGHDPGITILEVLAYTILGSLVATLLVRARRRRHRRS